MVYMSHVADVLILKILIVFSKQVAREPGDIYRISKNPPLKHYVIRFQYYFLCLYGYRWDKISLNQDLVIYLLFTHCGLLIL